MHVEIVSFGREIFAQSDVYRKWSLGSVIRHSLGFSNEENFSLLPRVVVHDVSTVVHVESKGWFVGIRWARAALEGVGRYYQRIGNRLKIRMHVQMGLFAREMFRPSGLYRK